MAKPDVRRLLACIDAALAEHHPKIAKQLRKGASATKLAKLERAAGTPLPAAFVEFLRWHDGASERVRPLDGLVWLGAESSASIKRMMDGIIADGHYASWADDEWWSTSWIPFADDESGYASLVVDLHGSFNGTPGQVLRAAAKDGHREILAPSFAAWLETFAQIVEADLFETDEDDDETSLLFSSKAEALFARRKGYPRVAEPRAVEPSFSTGPATAQPRAQRPADVPANARWLIDGDKHWLIAVSGKTVSTWTGKQLAKLRRSDDKARSEDAAKAAFDQALRKKLSAGFIYSHPSPATAERGELLCAFDVGDGCNAAFLDLAPDGRTLAVATMFRNAYGARLSLVDLDSCTRRELHRFEPGELQTFVHRVAFDRAGARVFVQLNTQLWQIPIADGQPKLLADSERPNQRGELFNPHVSRFDIDAVRERLLVLDKTGIRVHEISNQGLGKRLLHIGVKPGTSEYRELALSRSGRLLVAVRRSRALIYSHPDARADKTNEIQVWSVPEGKLVRSLPYGREDMLRGIGVSPDDRLLLVCDYGKLRARDIVSGKTTWTRDTNAWAWSPDGTSLALGQHGTQIELRAAETGRKTWTSDGTQLWAKPRAEIQRVECLGMSSDGNLVFEGGGSGRVYVWRCARR